MTGETPAVHEALAVYAPEALKTERVPPGYKLSEVGVIPEDWDVRTFNEIFDFLATTNNSREELNVAGTVLYVHYGDIHKRWNHLLDFSKESLPHIELSKVKNAAVLRDGDLILADASEDPEGVGKSVEVKNVNDAKAVAGLHTFLLRSRNQFLVSGYKGYIQSNESVKGSLNRISTGLKVYGISKNALKGVSLPLPPPSEQRAIAAALSDVDALIAALDKLIAKKRAVKTAAMQQLLTGKQRLPEFSGEWETKRFAEIVLPRRDRVDPRRSGYQKFCIELEHIESGTGRLLGSTSTGDQSSLKSVFRAGDVLFGKLRSYLRKYWLADRAGVCSTEFWVLSANHRLITPEFLSQIVSMDRFVEAASTAYGTHMPRADWNVVKNYEVPLPDLEEQTAIAAVLSDMDAEIEALEARREKTRQVKQGMMQELLTGRTRLV